MSKFTIAHYHNSNALMTMNGGRLIITKTEYIIKYFLLTVARYRIADTVVSKNFSLPLHRGITLNDGKKQIDIYFFSKTADKVYQALNL